MVFEFAHLTQFLEEQQSVLLAQLEKLDGDILRQRDAFDVLVSEEICRFSSLISELEEKNRRPARELLTVSPPHPRPPPTSGARPRPGHLPFTPRAREVLNSRACCPHRPRSLCILASHCPCPSTWGGALSLPASRGAVRRQREDAVETSSLKSISCSAKTCPGLFPRLGVLWGHPALRKLFPK